MKLRSEKKFRAFRETILRIVSESRAIDKISVVFRESPRRAISLKLCTQYEQYVMVEFLLAVRKVLFRLLSSLQV